MVNISRIFLMIGLAISLALPIRSSAQRAGAGAVFVMTNAAERNEVIAYRRNSDGSLGRSRRFSTGGRGSGGTIDPLASQGPLRSRKIIPSCSRKDSFDHFDQIWSSST